VREHAELLVGGAACSGLQRVQKPAYRWVLFSPSVLILFVFALVLASPFTEALNGVIQSVYSLLHSVYSIFDRLGGVDVDINRVTGFAGG